MLVAQSTGAALTMICQLHACRMQGTHHSCTSNLQEGTVEGGMRRGESTRVDPWSAAGPAKASNPTLRGVQRGSSAAIDMLRASSLEPAEGEPAACAAPCGNATFCSWRDCRLAHPSAKRGTYQSLQAALGKYQRPLPDMPGLSLYILKIVEGPPALQVSCDA